MSSVPPGWYPSPDRPDEVKWWNGTAWVDSPPPSATAQTGTVTAKTSKHRAIWILGAVLAGVIVIGIVLTIWLTGAKDDRSVADSASQPQTTTKPPSASATPSAEPEREPSQPSEPTYLPIGQTLTSTSYAVTINSVAVSDEIQTTGAPLTAEGGTDLVYVNATYTVLGPNAVDLTCAKYDIFVMAYDDQGGEMANLFAEPDLPGNPVCNSELVTGQSTEWNFAYKMVEGRLPAYLEIVDTNFYGPSAWGEPVLVALR